MDMAANLKEVCMKLIKSLALGLGAVLACSGMAQADTAVIPMGTIQYNPA